jgi:hypothetical protein
MGYEEIAMALPTHDELLRERFNRRKSEAQALVSKIASDSTSQYLALDALVPELLELAAYFGEQITFEVDPAEVAIKSKVMSVLGPIVTASIQAP